MPVGLLVYCMVISGSGAKVICSFASGARHDGARDLLEALSPREREVALAVGRGLPNAEIAAELHMSVATVKAHVSRLLAKLGVDNRVQIALLVQDATDAAR